MMEERNGQRTQSEEEAPEPERMITPDEEAGMDLAELAEPPQAEGAREQGDPEEAQSEGFRERRRNEGAD